MGRNIKEILNEWKKNFKNKYYEVDLGSWDCCPVLAIVPESYYNKLVWTYKDYDYELG